MPKLFELYTYHFLKNRFQRSEELKYHLKTHGNELDFLVNSGNVQMVVDAKYKPLYVYGKNHNDIRQVSGYARLQKVYDELGIADDKLIDCLIVYPDIENGYDADVFKTANLKELPVKSYKNVFKLGIRIPVK